MDAVAEIEGFLSSNLKRALKKGSVLSRANPGEGQLYIASRADLLPWTFQPLLVRSEVCVSLMLHDVRPSSR